MPRFLYKGNEAPNKLYRVKVVISSPLREFEGTLEKEYDVVNSNDFLREFHADVKSLAGDCIDLYHESEEIQPEGK